MLQKEFSRCGIFYVNNEYYLRSAIKIGIEKFFPLFFKKNGNHFHFFRLMDKGILIDDKFISKLKKGDVESFHQLYDMISPSMKLVCKRYVKNDADAEDVFQEGFLKVYKCIGSLKNAGSFWGWIKRIFVNTSLDQYKKTMSAKTEMIDGKIESDFENEENEDEAFTAADWSNGEMNYETIRKIDFTQEEMLETLQTLPEHFRVVFQLFVIDDYKHHEIAEILSINEKTSKTRLLRARGMLKKELYQLAIRKVNDGRAR